ncbi:FAD-dependent oxidoreductase [Jannaschia sp. Os4]|uniref:FAD-dependent oxidoreductase n=1 Tax=Jannaschia sp. Os4 TaxID=2807617 RepID=UPI00193AB4C6|nr:FAD-dependent oxidoreductase [Jannaschia sp. Os4]MBM2578121.1 FAD-dependent oxidoreductase [Jannaschia sp. Os4]
MTDRPEHQSAVDSAPAAASASVDPTDPYAREQQTFPHLSGEAVDRIRPYGREETLAPGTLVFERGERSVDFLVVLEGGVEIVERGASGEERVNTVHGRCQFTGELDLFNDRRILVDGRIAGPEGGGDARILRVPRAAFRRMVSTEADLGETITRAFILRRTGFIRHAEAGAVLIADHADAGGLADAIRMKRFLGRNGYPMRYVEAADPEAARLMDARGLTEDDLPAVLAPDDVTLSRPSIPDLADALGLTEAPEAGHVYDVAVVGAGPAGLSAAVYAASEGLDTIIVEEEAPGGQAGTSSRIENYLGFPIGISGQALAGRAWIQAQRFGARMAVSRAARGLDCDRAEDGRPFRVALDGGATVDARAVVLATGATYRRLGLPGEGGYENRGLHYAATALEAGLCENAEVAVVGGGNSAGQAAVFLSRYAEHVHVLVRGDGLADSMSDYLVQRIEDSCRITLRTRTQITALHGTPALTGVTMEGPDGAEERPITHIFVMIGAVPNTGWLEGCVQVDAKGFVCTGTDVTEGRPKSAFETSRPGVFAVGDLRAGSVKRVASGVGEGSVCVSAVHGWLTTDERNEGRLDSEARTTG